MLERSLRVLAGNDSLLGILIGQLFEAELATRDDLHRPRQRFPVSGKEPFHFLRRFQIAVGMALAFEADIVDGGVGPDAADDILQLAALRIMKQHVVRHHRADPDAGGEVRQIVQPQLVARPAAQGQSHIGAAPENLRHLAELHRAGLVRQIWDENADQPFRILGDVIEVQDAISLAASRFAERQ